MLESECKSVTNGITRGRKSPRVTSSREISSLERIRCSYRLLSNNDYDEDEDDDDSRNVSSMYIYLPAGAFRFITAQCASRTVQRPDFCVWSCVALEDRPDVARLTKRFGTVVREGEERETEREKEGKERRRGSEGQVTSNLWKVRGRHRLREIPKRASYIEPNFDTAFFWYFWYDRHNFPHMGKYLRVKIIPNWK